MQGTVAERLARLYDVTAPDWPGEIDFYRQHAAPVIAAGAPVLEIACGTAGLESRRMLSRAALSRQSSV